MADSDPASTAAAPAQGSQFATLYGAPSAPLRRFGRFEIGRLLGRSARTMVWLAFDARSAHEIVLVLPRRAPGADVLPLWLQGVRRAARLRHPNLAPLLEVGEHERWPYAAYDRRLGTTLAERLTAEGEAPSQAAAWIVDALDGLAYAHEAGFVHGDLQLHSLILGEQGRVMVLGLEAAPEAMPVAADTSGLARTLSIDPTELQTQRLGAQRDVLSAGLLLHHLVAGRPPLDEADTGAVVGRLPPLGRDVVRLPFDIPRSAPEPLRTIVNRATDRQPRRRYLAARTFARALQGWIAFDSAHEGGVHALLIDRVRQLGALPAAPGAAARAARLAVTDRERTHELAEIVLRDLALSFELLRVANTAQVRGLAVSGNGPVLTVRRAIAMVGLEGVQRVANGLRPWPGPLSAADAGDLSALIEAVRRGGRIAQALRPPGYDAEVVFLVTVLQNLGRLLVQFHFPDEAQQIRRLMQPPSASESDPRDDAGMSEEQAAFAVLGCDIEGMGAAVARHWGLDDSVLHMMRRLPTRSPVRQPDHDDDLVRVLASAANEAADALALPPQRVSSALDRVAVRYARVLKLQPGDLPAAIQAALAGRPDGFGPPVTPSPNGAAPTPAAADRQPDAAPFADTTP